MSQVELLALVGSLRKASVNRATANAAISQCQPSVSMSIFDANDVPLYNQDLEDQGLPDSVARLVERAKKADGIIFFSPEYNGSYPAVTKNLLDWLSRPPGASIGKPMTMVSTTPGPRAGQSLLEHFSHVMSFRDVKLFKTLGIGNYRTILNREGVIDDAKTLERLKDYVAEFASFCTSHNEE